MNYYLAIDIGASSGRHILSYIENGKIKLEEVYRFDNTQKRIGNYDCWDIDFLIEHIVSGLAACKTLGKIPKTVGIDTWAVDFVLLDKDNKVLGNSVTYRDKRTNGMDSLVESIVPFNELYKQTGIQKLIFNTIYQLMAVKTHEPETLQKAESFLMMPEYLNFLLTGIKKNEYTNATSTSLVNARCKTWDTSLIEKLGLPTKIFGKLHMPTETVGSVTKEIAEKIGYETNIILPATHDTGSAFLAVSASDDSSAYLSSGTWSLLGVENTQPITTDASRLNNFTNEGGAYYRYRYLKNIMGLWIIQSVRRELNGVEYVKNKKSLENNTNKTDKKWSFNELVFEAKNAGNFKSIIDVDKDKFLAPDSMIEQIKLECEQTNQAVPQTVGEIMQCVYQSLAVKYAKTIKLLESQTKKQYKNLHIVGGGCKDDYLNELTAKACGITVHAGPTEATALGNLIIQMIASGEIANLQSARNMIRESFEIKIYK